MDGYDGGNFAQLSEPDLYLYAFESTPVSRCGASSGLATEDGEYPRKHRAMVAAPQLGDEIWLLIAKLRKVYTKSALLKWYLRRCACGLAA